MGGAPRGPDNFTPPKFLSTVKAPEKAGPLVRVKLTRLKGGGCVLGAGGRGLTFLL